MSQHLPLKTTRCPKQRASQSGTFHTAWSWGDGAKPEQGQTQPLPRHWGCSCSCRAGRAGAGPVLAQSKVRKVCGKCPTPIFFFILHLSEQISTLTAHGVGLALPQHVSSGEGWYRPCCSVGGHKSRTGPHSQTTSSAQIRRS